MVEGPGKGGLCPEETHSGTHGSGCEGGREQCASVLSRGPLLPPQTPAPYTPKLSWTGVCSSAVTWAGQENTDLAWLGPRHLLLSFRRRGSCGGERRNVGQLVCVSALSRPAALCCSPFVLWFARFLGDGPQLLLSKAQMAALACLIKCGFSNVLRVGGSIVS